MVLFKNSKKCTEQQLYCALSRNEFSLLFQPQFDTVCGVMIGIEALLRWESPDMGWVSPSDFIPIAEETGLIFPISDWVIRQACRESKRFAAQKPHFRISINLSAKEFASPGASIGQRLQKILEEESTEPSNFELEITETNIMENYTTAVPIMLDLKTRGFHIACDDFGMGYSSLNRLKHLPLNTLKIDKSFIDDVTDDMRNHTIIQAILLIAKSLNFRVIAEGIERASQVEALRTLGCNLIQGHYLGKPSTVENISKLF